MELRHLRYFVAVAETLNFRRAAEKLRVAQPALSRQIKDLEHSVGARLLERNTGGASLTEAGIVLLEEARNILERVETAASLTRDAANGKRGRLNMAGLGSLTAEIFSETLTLFHRRYPQVEVNLLDIDFHSLLSEIQAGSVDLGFTFDSEIRLPSEFELKHVWSSKAQVAVGKNHRLSSWNQIPLNELVEEEILCVGIPNQNDIHRFRTTEIFAKRGIHHRPIKRIASLESLIAMVAGNYGVSVLFPNLACDSRQIVLRPVKEEGDDLMINLRAIQRKHTRSEYAENFVEILRQSRKDYDDNPGHSTLVNFPG